MLDEAELAAWLRLMRSPGLSSEAARRLLAAMGSPQAAVNAGPGVWREVAGSLAAQALIEPPEQSDAWLASCLGWLRQAPAQRHCLSLADPRYPAALLQTADPPFLLFAEGDLSRLSAPSLAVVGSRHATPQGLDNARAFAAHLSQAGYTIVSGLALGIDGAAHQGGLTGPGSTVAVIGTGPEQVYPRRHRALGAQIVARGLVVSEFLPGTPPLPPNFPRRNRIIAGLALGTLVVEAAPQSGSLITARLALDCNREVFAIPGSIHSPQSRGCHLLIKQGAKLVECAEDILSELQGRPRPAVPASLFDDLTDDAPAPVETDVVLRALGHDPATLDSLCARTGWPPADLNARLLTLELDGRVGRLPGGLFQRRGRA